MGVELGLVHTKYKCDLYSVKKGVVVHFNIQIFLFGCVNYKCWHTKVPNHLRKRFIYWYQWVFFLSFPHIVGKIRGTKQLIHVFFRCHLIAASIISLCKSIWNCWKSSNMPSYVWVCVHRPISIVSFNKRRKKIFHTGKYLKWCRYWLQSIQNSQTSSVSFSLEQRTRTHSLKSKSDYYDLTLWLWLVLLLLLLYTKSERHRKREIVRRRVLNNKNRMKLRYDLTKNN